MCLPLVLWEVGEVEVGRVGGELGGTGGGGLPGESARLNWWGTKA